MFWICPPLLLLLTLSWGGTVIAGRVEKGESYRKALAITGLLCLAVLTLWWVWS
jgi:hypothetical protein